MAIHNLPRQITTFIGRETEITTLRNLLEDDTCRLLTLTGPGGIGKSRLALEVVQKLRITFADGIYFIPLQSLQHPGQIIPAILAELQMEVESDHRQALLAHLREQNLLLIIDNCEHVLDGFDLVSDILNSALNVKILATSREALKLEGEWLREVHGLEYPEGIDSSPGDNYDAVRLFMERTQRLRDDFNISDQYADIVRICQLVEGLPLALELAAGWVKTLTCQEIAAEIQRNQDILTVRLHNAPERQHSIQAVFNQSWRLLTEAEQTVLRRFAVFRGGCTRQAAEQITGASITMLARFVEKSLLRHDPNRGRYDMQELLLQYTRERLKEAGELEEIHDLHGLFYGEMCHTLEGTTHGSGLMEFMSVLNAELDNIRVSWAGALERENYEIIWQLTHGLWMYYSYHFRSFELGTMYQSAVNQLSNHSGKREQAVLGRILARYGRWMATQAKIDTAEVMLKQSVAIALDQADMEEYYYAGRDLAWYILAIHRGQYATALSMMEDCVAYHRHKNDQYYLGLSLAQLAIVCELTGQLERQEALLHESYQIFKDIDFPPGMDMVLETLCRVAVNAGRWVEAQKFAIEVVERAKQYDTDVNLMSTICVYVLAATIAIMQGNFSQAVQYIQVIENKSKSSDFFRRHRGLIHHNNLCRSLIHDAEGEAQVAISLVEGVINKAENNTGLARLLEQSLPIYAWVLCSLEQFETATNQIVAILSASPQFYREQRANMLFTIASAVRVLAHQGELERATEILGFVFRHPNSPQGYLTQHVSMKEMRINLKMQLGEAVYTLAWERETERELEAVGHSLARELSSEGQDTVTKANQSLADPLTTRELEVLTLLGDRLSNLLISERLFITVGTVKSHTSKIYSKLDVANRDEAVIRAKELKLL